jgi:hypothetical protein
LMAVSSSFNAALSSAITFGFPCICQDYTLSLGSTRIDQVHQRFTVNDGANRRGVDCGPGAHPTTDSCRS